MEYLLLKAKLKELTKRLDLYFERRLKKEPRAKDDLENHKNDLLQSLAQVVYAKYNTETHKDYDPEIFIMLKAHDVWVDFIRVLDRRAKIISTKPIDTVTEPFANADFLQEFENKEMVMMIKNLLTPKEFNLLNLKAEGHSYDEIHELTTYPSANAAKTGFNRIKKFIRLRLRRP